MQGTTSKPIAHNATEHSAAIVSHHDSIKWFEAIPGEQLCIRVHGTQVNGRYAIKENIAAPGTATPMHFHAEDEIFHVLEGTVTFSSDGDVRRHRFRGREHETVVTNVFSGRPPRALVNRLACEIGFLADAVPDFPLPLGELEPLRAA